MADNDVFDALARARKACPELRLGQLTVAAATKVEPNVQLFYISDDKLTIGLGMMAASKLMSDVAAKKADQIKSYLVRKIGSSLDGEVMDHIAKIIGADSTE